MPTCLSLLPGALDHFIAGTRTSTANTNKPFSQDDFSLESLQLFNSQQTICKWKIQHLSPQANLDSSAIVQTINVPVAVTALHVSPSMPTALAVGSLDGSIRTFIASSSPTRLTLSNTITLISEKAAITSIRFHPLHPGVLACTLYSGSVYVIRIPGHGLQGD